MICSEKTTEILESTDTCIIYVRKRFEGRSGGDDVFGKTADIRA